MYKTPIDEFIRSYRGDDYSILTKCWSSSIKGKIITTKLSNDNTNLLVHYNIRKGSDKHYRLMFFHSLLNIENSKKTFKEIDRRQKKSRDDIYNDVYDDFSIKGDYKINSFAIKKDVIAFSRSRDFHSFYMIKRKSYFGKIEWRTKFKGITNDLEYFHCSYMNFLENDSAYKYSLFTIFLE